MLATNPLSLQTYVYCTIRCCLSYTFASYSWSNIVFGLVRVVNTHVFWGSRFFVLPFHAECHLSQVVTYLTERILIVEYGDVVVSHLRTLPLQPTSNDVFNGGGRIDRLLWPWQTPASHWQDARECVFRGVEHRIFEDHNTDAALTFAEETSGFCEFTGHWLYPFRRQMNDLSLSFFTYVLHWSWIRRHWNWMQKWNWENASPFLKSPTQWTVL